jgi:sialate O-acetylesterase
MAFRGAIWYQGESNAEFQWRVEQHRQLLPLLINDWRGQWGLGDFPFLFVQLPGMGRPNWPAFRNDQRQILDRVPNTGMAVTIDVGHPTNVHPRNKRPVGERLAAWALGTTYGRDIVYSGPLLKSTTVDGGKVTLTFEHAGTGLVSTDGEPLRHFEVAGTDGLFHAAIARIVGDKVVVSSNRVLHPRQICYAWTPFPDPPVNFFNVDGFPASPFAAEVK